MNSRTLKLDKHCAYCGRYFPYYKINDLITDEDWKNMYKNSSCGSCKSCLETLVDNESFRNTISRVESLLILSSWAYDLAKNFNRVTFKSSPVEFYYEKMLRELDERVKGLEETFKDITSEDTGEGVNNDN